MKITEGVRSYSEPDVLLGYLTHAQRYQAAFSSSARPGYEARRNIVELQSLSRSLVSTVQLKHLNFSTELEHALKIALVWGPDPSISHARTRIIACAYTRNGLDPRLGQPSEDPYAWSTRVLQRLSTVRHPGPRGSMPQPNTYILSPTALVVRSLAYCPGTFLHYNVW